MNLHHKKYVEDGLCYKRVRKDPAKKPEAEFYNSKKKDLQTFENLKNYVEKVIVGYGTEYEINFD